jgi:hypothetical protein
MVAADLQLARVFSTTEAINQACSCHIECILPLLLSGQTW